MKLGKPNFYVRKICNRSSSPKRDALAVVISFINLGSQWFKKRNAVLMQYWLCGAVEIDSILLTVTIKENLFAALK